MSSTEAQSIKLDENLEVTPVTEEVMNELDQNPYFEGNPFGDVVVIEDKEKEALTLAKEALLKLIEDNKDETRLQALSEEAKTKLFSQSEVLLKSYVDTLRAAKFNFPITRDEHKSIIQVIEEKLDYDVNDLFLALRLKFDFLDKIGNLNYKANAVRVLSVSVDTVAILFHLLSKYKAKGLSHLSLTYAMVVRKLGEIKKESFSFEEEFKSLTTIRNGWTATMDKPEEQVEAVAPNGFDENGQEVVN